MTRLEKLQQAGIRRLGSPKSGFRYPGARDLQRIRGLGIPPAWTDVAISRSPGAKLQAIGKDKKGRWHGKLFIPDRNMRVTAKLQRVSAQQLKVSGCAAGGMVCKAAIWTAWAGPLPTDTSVPAPK